MTCKQYIMLGHIRIQVAELKEYEGSVADQSRLKTDSANWRSVK